MHGDFACNSTRTPEPSKLAPASKDENVAVRTESRPRISDTTDILLEKVPLITCIKLGRDPKLRLSAILHTDRSNMEEEKLVKISQHSKLVLRGSSGLKK